MSTIRCVYQGTPKFPAAEQHPDAVRYKVRSAALGRDVFVDAIGGTPTPQEVDAVLKPPVADLSDFENHEKIDRVLVLLIAQYEGKTLAQAKADFRAIWNSQA